jgi:hypothetical protein
MTAEQRNRELLRVKEDMVAAWSNGDEEWLKELSQEKQRLNKESAVTSMNAAGGFTPKL